MNAPVATAQAVIDQLQQLGVSPRRLCLDSRQVQRGDVFVALHGAHRDGKGFVGDAIGHGAVAVLHDAPERLDVSVPSVAVTGLAGLLGELAAAIYGRPSEKLQVVGVTGTNGKTSVSQWIAQALNSLGKPCAVIGTLGNGFLGQLTPGANTTPDAIAVQGTLARLLEQGAAACAMEVSSIGLDQGRVNGVAFDTAVFTNLSRDHLDYHVDMHAYAAAKAKLFTVPGLKTAVLNLDDDFGVELAQLLRGKVRTLGYTLDPTPKSPAARFVDELWQARGMRITALGIEFSVVGEAIRAPVIGRFNASNLLAVMGALVALGVSAPQAAAALAALTPPPGRLQVANVLTGMAVQQTQQLTQPLVVVDYAHTPDALEKALTALREMARGRGGRLICVFGCGGDRDPGKRPMMGAVAERLADQVWVTSDNPRSEAPATIAAQIVAGMKSAPALELDRAIAIRKSIAAAAANDVVLLAGKGHESYQEVAGVKHAFSDIGSAQRALEQRASEQTT